MPCGAFDFFSEGRLTATQIKATIEETSGQKLSQWKIGQELKALGFKQETRKVFGKAQRLYKVIEVAPEKSSKEIYKDEAKKYGIEL